MSRGLGRIERVCLSVLEEAEADDPVIGRTALDLARVAFIIEGSEVDDKDLRYWWSDTGRRRRAAALSSVRRALLRLQAKGKVYMSGLTEGYDSLKGLTDINSMPYKHKHIVGDGYKLYRVST